MSDLYRYQTDPGQNPVAPHGRRCTRRRTTSVSSARARDIYAHADQLRARPDRAQRQHVLVRAVRPGLLRDSRSAPGSARTRATGSFMRAADGTSRPSTATTCWTRRAADPDADARQDRSRHRRHHQRRRAQHQSAQVFAKSACSSSTTCRALQPQGSTCYIDSAEPPASMPRPQTNVLQYSEEKQQRRRHASRSSTLITNERWFDANEKSIQTQDDATGQAISTVGHQPELREPPPL